MNSEEAKLLYVYWGKAALLAEDKSAERATHLLLYHCLDVAAVADAWWRSDTALRNMFVRATGMTEDLLKSWVLFFLALHDLGKWDVRFQLKAPEVALQLVPLFSQADSRKSRGFDHGQAGFDWFLKDQYDLPEEGVWWMQAVAGHHGRIPRSGTIFKPVASPEVVDHNRSARKQFVTGLKRLFLDRFDGGADCEIPDPPLQLAGFCSVCDWLGSDSAFFPYESKRLDFDEYFLSRQECAERALRAGGVLSRPQRTGGMKRLFPFEPRGVQVRVDQWPREPGLTLVEAPTGSGKTEAALAYASHLLCAELADCIIFALPTQATANAMLKRLDAVAPRLFQDGANVVLAHGKARFNSDFRSLKERAGALTVQGKDEALAQCVQWLASSRKRIFLGQIGVCTIDQVLLSVLPVRHNFVRGFGVQRSVLIVDEIHAYDSYMNGLLDCVLERQQKSAAVSSFFRQLSPPSVEGSSSPDGIGNWPWSILESCCLILW